MRADVIIRHQPTPMRTRSKGELPHWAPAEDLPGNPAEAALPARRSRRQSRGTQRCTCSKVSCRTCSFITTPIALEGLIAAGFSVHPVQGSLLELILAKPGDTKSCGEPATSRSWGPSATSATRRSWIVDQLDEIGEWSRRLS